MGQANETLILKNSTLDIIFLIDKQIYAYILGHFVPCKGDSKVMTGNECLVPELHSPDKHAFTSQDTYPLLEQRFEVRTNKV